MRLAGAPNFRDLGGIPAAQGRPIRSGRLYRSEAIANLDADEAAALARLGIGLVFDLRSAAEAQAVPNHYWTAQGAEVLAFDIGADVKAKGSFWNRLQDDARPETVSLLLQSVYRSIPMAVAPALRTLFDRLAQGAPPLLIHCSAGKDRTGVTVALLLHALGASDAAILDDYLETTARISESTLAHARRQFSEIAGAPISEDSLAMLAGVRGEFLAQSFSYIERKFGGADAFLAEHAGLDDRKREAMRAQVLG